MLTIDPLAPFDVLALILLMLHHACLFRALLHAHGESREVDAALAHKNIENFSKKKKKTF